MSGQTLYQPPRHILAAFVPTSEEVVRRMLELASVGERDIVYDLGCGDGRMVITAALLYGARGMGCDVEPYRVEQSQENAARAGVSHLVSFSLEDALEADISEASVVTLYLSG